MGIVASKTAQGTRTCAKATVEETSTTATVEETSTTDGDTDATTGTGDDVDGQGTFFYEIHFPFESQSCIKSKTIQFPFESKTPPTAGWKGEAGRDFLRGYPPAQCEKQDGTKLVAQTTKIGSVVVTCAEWALLRRKLHARGWSTTKMTAVVSDKQWDADPVRIKWHANLYGVTERPKIFRDMVDIASKEPELKGVRFNNAVLRAK